MLMDKNILMMFVIFYYKLKIKYLLLIDGILFIFKYNLHKNKYRLSPELYLKRPVNEWNE